MKRFYAIALSLALLAVVIGGVHAASPAKTTPSHKLGHHSATTATTHLAKHASAGAKAVHPRHRMTAKSHQVKLTTTRKTTVSTSKATAKSARTGHKPPKIGGRKPAVKGPQKPTAHK
jgi:hypothetical protein